MQVLAEHPEQRFQELRRRPAGMSGFDPLDIALHKMPPKALGDLALRETELMPQLSNLGSELDG